ncbi:hypothetical protein Dimus_026589 [Dionaea muscipula]
MVADKNSFDRGMDFIVSCYTVDVNSMAAFTATLFHALNQMLASTFHLHGLQTYNNHETLSTLPNVGTPPGAAVTAVFGGNFKSSVIQTCAVSWIARIRRGEFSMRMLASCW